MIEIRFKPRLYQETILSSCISKNTLIVLPTGLGKTKLAILVAVSRLNTFQGKILFLTPTKPLAGQIRDEFIKDTTLGEEEVVLFSGEVAPEKRGELIKLARVIVSTPQTISNDIISKRLNLEEISLLVLDDAHRNVKEYDYTWLCKQYNRIGNNVRIIGLTASPGDDLEKIQDVCKNAFIEEIEFRNEDDGDVKPYVQQMNIEWVRVSLSEEYLVVRGLIESCYNSKLDILKVSGFNGLNTKSDLLRLMRELQGRIVRGDKDFNLMKSVSSVAEVLKIQHGLELLETQGMKALVIYMNKLVKEAEKGKTKAVKNLVNDLNFRNALAKANHYLDLEHPKLVKLKEIILENRDKKIIVFNQYSDSIKVLEKELNQIEGIKSRVFVGQNNKNGRGMTQKKQLVLLDKFRGDEFNVLLSSSIGEEGLDIPKVDLVIFYEPVPSAIRTIQRRGRTARMDKGRVIVLMTKNTRDEAYHWVAFHKEKRMKELLKSIKNKLNLSQDVGLNKYIDKIKIIVDFREKGSSILKNLVDLGVDLNLRQLDVGDFVFGRIGIERKSVRDFVDSLIDGMLLSQIKELRRFERPLLLIEGEDDIFSVRKVHPNAIFGMIGAIAVDFNIPILYTKNSSETAALIKVLAKRELEERGDFGIRIVKKPTSTKELQEFVVSSFPGIGGGLNKRLLEQFGSVRKIVNSSIDELKDVEGIGERKARDLVEIFDEEY